MRLQKLLGRGRELLIYWEAPMASTFISSFSAQGEGREEVQAGDDQGRPWPSKFNMQAANEHYKMKRDDSFELALHLPGDEVAFNLSSLTSD